MAPTSRAMNMPPTAPAAPPMPMTDPTALRGNMSDGRVNRLADQPWWAAAASEINPTATHRFEALAANMTGAAHNAQTNIAVLRARLTDQPNFINRLDSQPPPMLPTSATM